MTNERARDARCMLEGRVAIVTGAGQGLGRAFAHGLAVHGAAVVASDIDGARAERVAKEISAFGRSVAMQVDVAQESSVAAMIQCVLQLHGRIDILINNAAIFSTIRMKPFEELTIDEWNEVMAVNLGGVFLCCRAVAPVMKQRRYGKIVNISSATALSGRPYYLHYVASKAAIIGLTRALASELGPFGVTVNALTPGATRTEVPRATVTASQWKTIVASQAIPREGAPEDLVGAVAFLSSSESDFITGQTLNVDGGSIYR